MTQRREMGAGKPWAQGCRTRPGMEGMTLIEIMVAITIFSMVMAMIWGGISQMAKNKTLIEQQVARQHAISMTLQRMEREISAAYVSVHRHPSFSMQAMQTAFIGSDGLRGDRLDFASFSNQRLRGGTWESDQHEIGYFVTDNREGVSVLARREQKRIDEDPQRGGTASVMLEGVERFEVEFLDPMTQQWVKEWNTTQSTGQLNRLPSQVKIVLEVSAMSAGRGTERFATRVSVPMQYALNHARYNP